MVQRDATAHHPELSVVILCYHEEDFIPQLVASVETAIQQLGVSYELVLVANYSTTGQDRSPDIVAAIAKDNPHVRIVTQLKQGMMGWDMRTGFEASAGNVIAIIDGDGQVHPRDIGRLYRTLSKQRLDLCQANRLQRADGWRRVVVSRVYNGLFRLLFPGIPLHDINAKPKVMTREAYQRLQLTSTDWFIDAEMVIQARRQGWRVGEMSTVFSKGRGRPSWVKAGAMAEFVKNLFLFRFRESLSGWRGDSKFRSGQCSL